MGTEEFVDHERPVRQKFQALSNNDENTDLNDVQKSLQNLIQEDPDFLEPYLVLDEIYTETGDSDKSATVTETAFRRAISLITNKEGDWPDRLPWVPENQHIIRTLLHKAISDWEQRRWDEALDLLRFLLITNPNDNIAARNYILAIRMGFTFPGFEDRFNMGGYYNQELTEWFEEHVHRFPDEFDWWLKWRQEQAQT